MGSVGTGNSVHVIHNERGIIHRITGHKAIDRFQNYGIGGLFRVIFGVQDSNENIVK